jgi:hypothetical protein
MRALVVSAALALLPEVVSLGSDGLALTSGGIEVRGAAVTLYCPLRAMLALVLLLSCLSAGALDRRFIFRQQVSVALSAAEVILNLGTGTALMNMRSRLVASATVRCSRHVTSRSASGCADAEASSIS